MPHKPKPIPSKTNHYCFRCQIKLGKILNRGSWCPVCRRKICKKCLASSSNSNSTFCQKSLHQTFINYQLINQKQYLDARYDLKFSNNLNSSKDDLLNNNNLPADHRFDKSIDNLSPVTFKNIDNFNNFQYETSLKLNNNQTEQNFTNKNLSKSNPSLHDKEHFKDEHHLDNTQNDQNKEIPKKVKRKNTGIYIKRATSSAAADSLVARRYKANLNNSSRINSQQETKCLNDRQLSKSCSELNSEHEQAASVSYCKLECTSLRSTSEQNLNKNLSAKSNDELDKSTSLPKFNLNRLISKLKRSHTVGNVNDIEKRTAYAYQNRRSNTLKNENNQKSSTLWRRSSATLAQQGHQLYLKTLTTLGRKSLFKRQNVFSSDIPICKLKGLCAFCCTKM